MNQKQANIKVTRKQFFRYWLRFTKSFHDLAPREMDVLAQYLYYHSMYSEQILNDKVLWKTVFDYETKIIIKKELGMKDAQLQNMMTTLRKKKVIINGKINKIYIPNISPNADSFKIIYNLIINEEETSKEDKGDSQA